MRPDTVKALRRRRNGSLRKLAVELGFPPSFAGTLSDVLNGRRDHVSREIEDCLREALGLPPLGQPLRWRDLPVSQLARAFRERRVYRPRI